MFGGDVGIPQGDKGFLSLDARGALAAVGLWAATLLVVWAGSGVGVAGWHPVVALLYLPAGLFVARSFAKVSIGTTGTERLFWAMIGAGVLLYFAGSPLWSPARDHGSWLAMLCYALSSLLLFGALVTVLSRISRRARYVAWLDALGVVFSVGIFLSYFLATPAELAASTGDWRQAAVVFSGPVLSAGLLYLSLVLVAVDGSPPFSSLLATGFLAILISEGAYLLGTQTAGLEVPAVWQQVLWLSGPVLLALDAGRSCPAAFEGSPWELGADPKKHAAFWFGPLSPATHFVAVFAWAAFRPPVPGYVALAGAVLALYLALRVSLFSYAVHRLRKQRDGAIGRLEQERLSEELHDNLKQSVYGSALLLDSYRELKERGKESDAEELLAAAIAASREAVHRVGLSIEELRARCTDEMDLLALLRERLDETRNYSGIGTHEDLRAGLAALTPEQRAACYRIASEALWNAAKHSGARNVRLETRQVGSVFLLNVRDDGRGVPPDRRGAGIGLSLMREKARAAGGTLEVISHPGRGTTVQARFELR